MEVNIRLNTHSNDKHIRPNTAFLFFCLTVRPPVALPGSLRPAGARACSRLRRLRKRGLAAACRGYHHAHKPQSTTTHKSYAKLARFPQQGMPRQAIAHSWPTRGFGYSALTARQGNSLVSIRPGPPLRSHPGRNRPHSSLSRPSSFGLSRGGLRDLLNVLV